MGAEFNAFTDKENICIYADFLDTHLEQGVELLFDVTLNPSFLPENIKTEKKIIMEEIKMVEDNPSEDIFNYFYKVVLDGHPLSLPVLGTRKSIAKLSTSDIWGYFNKKFTYNNIVVSAAGNIKHNNLVDNIKKNIDRIEDKKFGDNFVMQEPEIRSVRKVYRRKTKATHICYGGIGCRRECSDRYPLSLFTNVLGGSMSSRLFQKIREEEGLSYSIYASNTQYIDTGIIVIYAASSPKNVYRILDLVDNEIADIKKNGIKDIELDRAKENIKGNIVLGTEDISSRMFRLGKGLLIDGKVLTIDEILKKIDRVRVDDLNKIALKYFNQDRMNLVILGVSKEG